MAAFEQPLLPDQEHVVASALLDQCAKLISELGACGVDAVTENPGQFTLTLKFCLFIGLAALVLRTPLCSRPHTGTNCKDLSRFP